MATTTKGKRIDGTATVSRIGVWYPTSAWEQPQADFTIDGETYTWRATDEMVIPSLNVGDTVHLAAFARANGRLYRVTVTR